MVQYWQNFAATGNPNDDGTYYNTTGTAGDPRAHTVNVTNAYGTNASLPYWEAYEAGECYTVLPLPT
jgi:hypothetical protein